MDITLTTPVRFVPRIGPMMAQRLEKLEIRTVQDLLYHIPFRYDDFSLISPIVRIQPGETVTIRGSIKSFGLFTSKSGRRIAQASVSDNTGTIPVIWFNQPYLRNVIKPGLSIELSGTVSWFGAKKVLANPQFELPSQSNPSESLHTGRIVPIYPLTAGVSSKWLRGRIAYLLDEIGIINDPIPKSVLDTHKLIPLSDALRHIHYPEGMQDLTPAKRRLAFDELFLLQIAAHLQKAEQKRSARAPTLSIYTDDVTSLIHRLPFTLTNDQNMAVDTILKDCERMIPMNRLLVGDVGSGKTVVAAIALFNAVRNGYQGVLLAPTQILAEQHYRTISEFLAPARIEVSLMTGATKNRSAGQITVGTHAMLSESVSFNRLGLIVVDEQHRFGVKQRAKLTESSAGGTVPHLLTMTATPIPRTLAKTVFGSIDLTQISEMPKGRKPVKTWAVGDRKRESAYAWINKTLKETGAQAFIICPLIEESDDMEGVKAATTEYERLKTVFKDYTLGLLHGRLKPKEKTDILSRFSANAITILVATPVVEVGIDVPNATIMMIEGAQRFGLGQLHQLRGRVGRGKLESYCILFHPDGDSAAYERLKAMETNHSGADLAEIDLKIRGPGDIFGSRQHGLARMKIASYMDLSLVRETYDAVSRIISDDPLLENLPHLRESAKQGTIETIVAD